MTLPGSTFDVPPSPKLHAFETELTEVSVNVTANGTTPFVGFAVNPAVVTGLKNCTIKLVTLAFTTPAPNVKAAGWKLNPRLKTELLATCGFAKFNSVTTAIVPLLLCTIEAVNPAGRLVTVTKPLATKSCPFVLVNVSLLSVITIGFELSIAPVAAGINSENAFVL